MQTVTQTCCGPSRALAGGWPGSDAVEVHAEEPGGLGRSSVGERVSSRLRAQAGKRPCAPLLWTYVLPSPCARLRNPCTPAGACSAMGVVTRMRFRLHDVSDAVTGVMVRAGLGEEEGDVICDVEGLLACG